MATKKSKAAPTDDELNKLLEGIEDEAQTPVKGASKSTKTASSQSEQDLLAELENLGAQQPPSRPHTPRIQSVKRSTATPPPASSRDSEEKASGPRKSAESTRSYHTSFTPSATSSDLQEAERKVPVAQPAEPAEAAASTGGGWWGGIFATASAAVKTAEAAVKEIQHNEEAKRWAEQVKGNIGVLQGFGKTAVAIPIIQLIVSIKVVNFDQEHFQHLQTSFTPSRPPSHPTNASKYTSPMTSLATPPLIPSSTLHSPA